MNICLIISFYFQPYILSMSLVTAYTYIYSIYLIWSFYWQISSTLTWIIHLNGLVYAILVDYFSVSHFFMAKKSYIIFKQIDIHINLPHFLTSPFTLTIIDIV